MVRITFDGDNFVFKAIRDGAMDFTCHVSDYKGLEVDLKARV